MIIFAHRGASGYAPENTMAAMKKAIALGARAVELDIHSVEGELYVFHDRRLEGKSTGTGLIHRVTKAYLDGISVDGEPIATLWEVMGYLREHDCIVNIELKGLTCLKPFIALYPRLLSELHYRAEQLIISSFHHPFLPEFSRHFPEAYVAPLIEGTPLALAEIATRLNAHSIHLSLSFITPELIEDAHARGVSVFVYTVDHPDDMTMLQALGVDGIFTNYPDIALARLTP